MLLIIVRRRGFVCQHLENWHHQLCISMEMLIFFLFREMFISFTLMFSKSRVVLHNTKCKTYISVSIACSYTKIWLSFLYWRLLLLPGIVGKYSLKIFSGSVDWLQEDFFLLEGCNWWFLLLLLLYLWNMTIYVKIKTHTFSIMDTGSFCSIWIFAFYSRSDWDILSISISVKWLANHF